MACCGLCHGAAKGCRSTLQSAENRLLFLRRSRGFENNPSPNPANRECTYWIATTVLLLAELQRDSRQTVQQLAERRRPVERRRAGSASRRWRRPASSAATRALVDREKRRPVAVRARRGQPDAAQRGRRCARSSARSPPARRSSAATARPAQADYMIKVLVAGHQELRGASCTNRVQAAGRDAHPLERRAEGGEGRRRRADRRRARRARAGRSR